MNIFRDGALIDVNVSYWSGAKILTPDDLGLKDEEVAEAFSLGRKMLVPRDIIKKFRAIEARARHAVEKNSFKFPIGSARFIPKRKFPQVIETLKTCQEEYTDTVVTLVTNYEKYREDMVPIYREAAETAYIKSLPAVHEFSIESMESEKSEFIENFLKRIEKHYPAPETLSKRFSLTWDVYEVTLPNIKKKGDKDEIKNSLDDEYRQQAEEKIGNFLDEVVLAMRQETAKLCEHVIGNIKSGKVIREKTIQSLHSFIDNFSELNFVGDEKIEAQLDTLKKEFLNIYDTKEISNKSDLTAELSRRLHDITEVAKTTTDINTVTGEYRRKINWQDN